MKVLLVSAFYESAMPSLREHQYARALSDAGYEVTLLASTGSNVWKYSRSNMKPTDPMVNDEVHQKQFNFRIVRRRAWLRYSDFFVIPPPISLIREADIVHVIEFRQGFTAVIAMIAKLLGKFVVYDHEQRGDRHYSVLHRIDSIVRNLFISFGSIFVDAVRHTVFANAKHFQSRALKQVPLTFAPLGADEDRFGFDAELRTAKRKELGLEREKIALISGKLTEIKRPLGAIEACIECGYHVVVAGRVDEKIGAAIDRFGPEQLTRLGWQPPTELNKLYCAADIVIYTAFTVSYWEAAATGAEILVPSSSFSAAYLEREPRFHLFGESSMFTVEDEEISPEYPLKEAIVNRLKSLSPESSCARSTVSKWLWNGRREEFATWYRALSIGGAVQ